MGRIFVCDHCGKQLREPIIANADGQKIEHAHCLVPHSEVKLFLPGYEYHPVLRGYEFCGNKCLIDWVNTTLAPELARGQKPED